MPVERRGQAIAFEIGSTGNGRNPIFNGRRQPSCGGTSRMTRESQVRICERLGVKFPGPTRLVSRVTPVQTALRNCTRDEGRSFEAGSQVQASMLTVETIGRIRREHFIKGKTIREIARDLKVSRNTVRKVLRSGATTFEYERNVQPRPKLGRWTVEIEAL